MPPEPSEMVRSKKVCCRDKPRCKRCPVTLKRLAEAGYAERQGPRNYLVVAVVPKKVRAKARAR